MRRFITLVLLAMSQLYGQIIETAHFSELVPQVTKETLVIIDIDDDDQLPQRPKPARIIDLTHKESKYKQTSLFTHLRPKRKSHLCIDSDSEEELTYEVDSKS